VFKRFYRVDGSRSREGGGAGLGLSIVKSICLAHGAEVEVTSVPGEGSRFRIRQPLAAEAMGSV
jgi:two-component system phosphate regulon sensor histidine kinase PhoR